MRIKTIDDAATVASMCSKYEDLEIDARCSDRRYVVDAKSFMGLQILVGGGDITFTVIDTSKPSYPAFLRDVAELSRKLS